MGKNIGKLVDSRNPDCDYSYKHALVANRKSIPKYMNPDEIHALLRVIESPRDQAIFRLGYHHGLRSSEIGMIQMRDYRPGSRPDQDYLEIFRLKGSRGGDTLLIPAAAMAIRKWIKHRGWEIGPMFLTRQSTPITQQRLDILMKRYCKMAGVPREKAHFHALKHTCATMLLSVFNENIVQVQKHLGHARIQSTMIYADLTEAANKERSARLKNWR
jgi:integrase/recombinase XerD